MRSIADVQLYSSHEYFVNRFSGSGILAKRNDRLSSLLACGSAICHRTRWYHHSVRGRDSPLLLPLEMLTFCEALPELATVLVVLLRIAVSFANCFSQCQQTAWWAS